MPKVHFGEYLLRSSLSPKKFSGKISAQNFVFGGVNISIKMQSKVS